MKHTPGPWHINEKLYGYYVIWADDREICTLNPNFPPEANARLIVAAPDLLEALEDCCTRMERCRSILQDPRCGGNPESNWGMLDTQKARAAISKAEGGNDGK